MIFNNCLKSLSPNNNRNILYIFPNYLSSDHNSSIPFWLIYFSFFFFFLLLLLAWQMTDLYHLFNPIPFLFLYSADKRSTIITGRTIFVYHFLDIAFQFLKIFIPHSFNYSRNIKRCHISLVGGRDSHLMPASDEFPLIYYSVDV